MSLRDIEVLTARPRPRVVEKPRLTKIRLTVFTGREDALLVHAGDHVGPVVLPPLSMPFSKASVAAECRSAGVEATVIKSMPGRWTRGLIDARAAEQGARANEQRQAQALQATMMLGASSAHERDRAALITRLQQIPAEQRQAKADIAAAVARRANGGAYLPREQFQALRDKEAALKEETIAIHAKLSKLNEEKKAKDRASAERFEQRFIAAAKDLLDEETFVALVDAARDEGDDHG